VLPSNPRRCDFCHEPKSVSGAAQADAWMTNPSRQACGSCHDNVNFATGKNHVNLPQVSDRECKNCHIPQGELEFDASIKGAHTMETQSATRPGLVFDIIKIDDGQAGKKPTVTFKVTDSKGNGLTMAQMTGGLNRLGLVMAGATSDYGYTSFAHAIPADAKGTYSIGLEGRRQITLLEGTEQQVVTEYGAINKVKSFSVDGSRMVERRKVVDIAKCNSCHSFLSLHGENRNQIEQCVLCHNASETDATRRAVAVNSADKAAPNQGVNFALMIHRIHTGEKIAEEGGTYTIVGFGGSHNDFSEVRYPVMTPSGGVANTAKCYMCHVNNSEATFPIGKNNVIDPQGRISPVGATTSACTGCHLSLSALSHSVSQTDAKFGESCDICHGIGKDFDVLKSHAGK